MDLLKKFKDAEGVFDAVVAPRKIYAIRVDGRSFRTYTKGFDKPYDKRFIKAMDDAAALLCKEVSGALFGYVQSDEITIFLSDLQGDNSELWFGGRLNKWVSTAASIASVSISRSFPERSIPTFDARVLQLEDMADVELYLDWRARDAYKNAITMAASCHRSHRELMDKNTTDRIAILEETEHAEEKLPLGFRYGRIVMRKREKGFVDILANPRHEATTLEIERYKWVITPATVDVIRLAVLRTQETIASVG